MIAGDDEVPLGEAGASAKASPTTIIGRWATIAERRSLALLARSGLRLQPHCSRHCVVASMHVPLAEARNEPRPRVPIFRTSSAAGPKRCSPPRASEGSRRPPTASELAHTVPVHVDVPRQELCVWLRAPLLVMLLELLTRHELDRKKTRNARPQKKTSEEVSSAE